MKIVVHHAGHRVTAEPPRMADQLAVQVRTSRGSYVRLTPDEARALRNALTLALVATDGKRPRSW